MKTQFTKGEWYYEESEIHNRLFVATNKDQRLEPDDSSITMIAFCIDSAEHERFVSEAEANAKLIAAAPDLLWALASILDTLEDNIEPDDLPLYGEIQDANQAIKKATS